MAWEPTSGGPTPLDGAPNSSTPSECYVLGFNGPMDAEGIGRPERFVWRWAVLEAPGKPSTLLAFSSMPKLIAFTREVNGRRAFTLPTEARRCRLALALPDGLGVWTDPSVDDFLTRYASTQAREAVIDGLEG